MLKGKYQERIKEYEAEKERLIGALNALNGAIEDCKYWLAELEKEEKTNASSTGTETKS